MKLKQGRPVEYDWKALHKDYESSKVMLTEFCAARELSYTNTSREFSAIEREETRQLLERTQKILAKNLPQMAEGLVALSQDEDKNIQLKAISTAMDRAGLSVQAINVQVNNTATVTIMPFPIFAIDDAPLMDKLFESEK